MPTTKDKWLSSAEISAKLLEQTGHPGPGLRRLLTLAADAKLPMMTRRDGRWWGAYESDIPNLAKTLETLGLIKIAA